MPTDEEKTKIFEAQVSNTADIPLGTAEQFLQVMGTISELSSRLRLWLFKLDYETIESVRILVSVAKEKASHSGCTALSGAAVMKWITSGMWCWQTEFTSQIPP